jgi:hypothetical protein
MNINTDAVCALLINAIRQYPSDGLSECKTPNAFRLIQRNERAELITDNFGALSDSIGTPYFYSRTYEASGMGLGKTGLSQDFREYPAVILTETSIQGIKPFRGGGRVDVGFQLSVIDRYLSEDCTGDCGECAGRTIIQIEQDTEKILRYLLAYMGQSQWNRIRIGNRDVDGLFHQKQIENSVVYGGDIQEFGSILQSLQQTVEFGRYIDATNRLHGTLANVTLPLYLCELPSPNIGLEPMVFENSNCNCC